MGEDALPHDFDASPTSDDATPSTAPDAEVGEDSGTANRPPPATTFVPTCTTPATWTIETLGTTIDAPDTGLDDDGTFHTVYAKDSATGLRHDWRSDTTAGSESAELGFNMGLNPALAIGPNGTLHVAAFGPNTSTADLRHFHRAPGGSWQSELIEPNVRGLLDIASSPSGDIAIILGENAEPYRVMLFVRAPAANTWHREVIIEAGFPAPVGVAFVDGTLRIFYTVTTAREEVAWFASSLPSGGWIREVIYRSTDRDISRLPFAFDAKGGVHMAIPLMLINNLNSEWKFEGGLKYLYRSPDHELGEPNGWWIEEVEKATAILRDDVWTGEVPYMDPSIVLDDGGGVHLSYAVIGAGDLRFSSRRSDGTWLRRHAVERGYVLSFPNTVRAPFAIDSTGRIFMAHAFLDVPGNFAFMRRAIACLGRL